MGKQQVFGKRRPGLFRTRFNLDRQREPGQGRVRLPLGAVKSQWHQAGAAFNQFQTELLGDRIAEIGGPNLRNRQATRGNDHRWAVNYSLVGINLIANYCFWYCRRSYIIDQAGLPASDRPRITLCKQHVDEIFCRAVTKQLALVLFMKTNPMLLHQRHEVQWRVPCQR